MKQFILTKEPDKKNIVRLDGNDYHYIVRVRRLAVGEFFPALLPDGREALIQILSIKRGVLTGMIQEKHNRHSYSNFSSIPIILFQAMPKGEKMDLIVRQAAEGGIAEIVPFVCEFSLMKKNIVGEQKLSRWERIVKEARQQSGSKTVTYIRRPAAGSVFTISELVDYWNEIKKNAAGLLFHHKEGLEHKSLHEYLSNIEKNNVVVFAIGPEGGFSEKEVKLFLENGFKPITIGDTILRTETAAVYCAAAIRILLLEKDSWELRKTKTYSG